MSAACWQDCCRAVKVSENGTVLNPPKGCRWVDSEWSIASGTLIQRNHPSPGKLCDFLILRSKDRALVGIAVELKSRVVHANDILDQLRAGLDRLSGASPSDYVAILVYSGRMSNAELRILRKKKLMVGGRRVMLQTVRSGSSMQIPLAS